MSVAAFPEIVAAAEPPERHGHDRSDVALLVSTRSDGAIAHGRMADLPHLLAPGDLVVINVSATLPAALPGRIDGDEPVRVHLSTPLGAGRWVVEVRAADGSRRERPPFGERIGLPACGSAVLRGAPPRQRAPGRGRPRGPGRAPRLPSPPRRADPLRRRAAAHAGRAADRVRARARQRRDAERRAAADRRADHRAGGRRRARRAARPARRRLLARARRDALPRALPGPARDRAPGQRHPRLGRARDRDRDDGRPRARDRGVSRRPRARRRRLDAASSSSPGAGCAPSTACSRAGTSPSPRTC